jgi:WD40 repeat protein
MLTHTKLKGHRAAVLCLDISSPVSSTSSLLLSGSEDGTARLWDLREHQRRGACLCIQTIDGGDVLSAVFAPPHPQRRPSTTTASSTPSLSSSFAQDYTVYLGVENTVLEYDLRNATSPILSEPTNNWGRILQNQDEVNQIGLAYYNNNNNSKNNNNIARNKNKKNQKKKKGGGGNKKQQHQQHSNHQRTDNDGDDNEDGNDGICIEGSSLYLAACDDAGKIRYTETTSSSSSSSNYSNNNDSSTSSTILHHDEHGVAVVTACAFRPNSKQLELISGGTDCKIQLWDILRPK